MKNEIQFAALVSDAGNWDKVVDVADDDQYKSDLQGRTELGWYDTPEEAQAAIDEYRKEQQEHDEAVIAESESQDRAFGRNQRR